jgi:hypothetical protein
MAYQGFYKAVRDRSGVVWTRCSPWILFAMAIVFAPRPLYAHVPGFVSDNVSLETAVYVPEPEKSWVKYSELAGEGDARWFSFDFNSGDPMEFELFVSPDSDPEFAPKLALVGPGITPSGSLPGGINLQGLAASVYSGTRDEEPEFEPFTPSQLYFILHVDSTAPASGRYYAVVFSGKASGKFGLAIGSSESFTPAQWINIPVAVLSTYRWEGQSLAFIFLPFAGVMVVGCCFLFIRVREKRSDWEALMGMLAGMTFLGSAALYGTQVLCKVYPSRASESWLWFVPVVIISIQILLGIGVIRSAAKRRPVRTAIYGALGLVAWAGYILGPIMAIASAAVVGIRRRHLR